MKYCTFFGHRDATDSLHETIKDAIREQIRNGITFFYVGTHGNFDRMVLICLRELKKEYPAIRYAVVLAYYPSVFDFYAPGETVFPEGIEHVPKRFSIDFRNRWMLDRSDVVIVYATRPRGGAAKYLKIAEKKSKIIKRIGRTEK